MRVFLSYAEEDRETARIITDRLNDSGIDVYNWLSPAERGLLFINRIEEEIPRVNFFLALISPSFRESFWCKREVGLALQREAQMQEDNPAAYFIRVLEVRRTAKPDAGLLGGYDWLDFTRTDDLERGVRELAARLKGDAPQATRGSGNAAVGGGSPASQQGSPDAGTSPQGSSLFRNREDELDKVLRGLTTGGGSHFWLVVAPPQLGKTWFLNRVSGGMAQSGPISWITSLVNLSTLPPADRRNPGALLARMLPTTPNTAEQDTTRSIAREILRAGRPHLCLLDSAELLDEETTGAVRKSLTEVYHLVAEAGVPDVRLGVVVASRRDDYWKGVMPYPRLSPLSLTEFKTEVVQQALHDLARDMRRNFPAAEIRRNSHSAHRLTEGLPALLVRCLDWIQAEQWLGMDRLESQELFQKLADPYIQDGLLAQASLFPGHRRADDEPVHVLEHAYRVLAPYRLFTQSHLRHHLGRDHDFSDSLATLHWSMTDLWQAISGTALLSRPLNEPWQEIHAAIRRLLYRYFYRSDERRAEAHDEARKFVRIWAQKQIGTEQVVGLVECLWHEANMLRLRKPAEMERRLAESARNRCHALRPSPAYTLDELKSYAMQRMRNDDEFQEAVGSALFNRLVDIVVEPQEP